MPDNDDTPKEVDKEPTLEELLKQQRALLESEFDLSKNGDISDVDTIRGNAATSFLRAVPEAVRRICYLMEHAEKDTTQLAAAKYIVATAFSKDGVADAGDPLSNLVKLLQANDETSSEPHES